MTTIMISVRSWRHFCGTMGFCISRYVSAPGYFNLTRHERRSLCLCMLFVICTKKHTVIYWTACGYSVGLYWTL